MTTMMGTPMPSMMPQQHVVAGTANSSMGLTSAASLVMASQQHEPGTQKMMYGAAPQQMQYMHPRRASADNLMSDSSNGANIYSTVEGDTTAAEMKQRSMSTPATPKQSELSLPPDAPLMMVPGNNQYLFLVYLLLFEPLTFCHLKIALLLQVISWININETVLYE